MGDSGNGLVPGARQEETGFTRCYLVLAVMAVLTGEQIKTKIPPVIPNVWVI